MNVEQNESKSIVSAGELGGVHLCYLDVEKVFVRTGRVLTLLVDGHSILTTWHAYFIGCHEWGFRVWAHNTCLCEYEVVENGEQIFIRQKGVTTNFTEQGFASKAEAVKWLAQNHPTPRMTGNQFSSQSLRNLMAADDVSQGIKRFTDAELEAQRVIAGAGGRLYWAKDGKPVTLSRDAIYTMDSSGNVYAYRHGGNMGPGDIQHSTLGNHGVVNGGHIEVDNGVVKFINNKSGHYKPTQADLTTTTTDLTRQGVDLSNAQIVNVAP